MVLALRHSKFSKGPFKFLLIIINLQEYYFIYYHKSRYTMNVREKDIILFYFIFCFNYLLINSENLKQT